MNYFHKFNSTDAFELSKYGDGTYQEPWVSWNEEDDSVSFNKTYREMPFTIKALDDDTDVVILNDAPDGDLYEFEYSTDNGQSWTAGTIDVGAVATYTLMLNDTISFRSDYESLYSTDANSSIDRLINIKTTGGDIEVYGNIMSLLDSSNFYKRTSFDAGSDYNFYYLFKGNTCLIDASNLILPATTLTEDCYESMFSGCTRLTTAPELPATILAANCYYSMFYGCTGLTTAPALPATTLAQSCYSAMFSNCTGLTTAPELPATTLAGYCYSAMFNGCTGLTTAPELPVITLAGYCYSAMFYGCTGLTTAPELPATTLTRDCYTHMFSGCTGLTSAPELPATTLADYCYSFMFYGCSNLNYIKAMFTTTPSNSYTENWVKGVAATGTFVKNSAATWTTTGINGIPTGWTVETASA